MFKNSIKAIFRGVSIFTVQGHGAMFVFFPFALLIMKYPHLNVFTGTTPHLVIAALLFFGLVLILTEVITRTQRLVVATWLGGVTAYLWLAASVVLRPTSVTFLSRSFFEKIIMVPLALWFTTVTVLVGAALVFGMLILVDTVWEKYSIRLTEETAGD